MRKSIKHKNLEKVLQEELVASDKLMIIILFVQWFIAVFISSQTYGTYMMGLISGAIITLVPFVLFRFFKGTKFLRSVIATSMMLYSMLFIQQHFGRIEMHFHVFIGIAFLTYYKDSWPIYVATFVTIVYHALFNILQQYDVTLFDIPLMVFNYGCGWDIVSLHGFFAFMEGVVLGYMANQQNNIYKQNISAHNKLLNENKINNYLLKKLEQLEIALDENSLVSKTDSSGVITYANEKFAKLSGYTTSELIGQSHSIIRHPEMPSLFFKNMWNTLLSKKVFKGTIQNRKKNGDSYYVSVTIIPLLNDKGEIDEFLSVRNDVTELVSTKQALAAEHAKERFVATLSNELLKPLDSIIKYTNRAINGNVVSEMKKDLDKSLNSSEQLKYIIDDILDVAKTEKAKLLLEAKSFNLDESVEKLVSSFKDSFLEKELDFRLNKQYELSIELEGDWKHISQILTNLLSNAIKFTPVKGKIYLSVEYTNAELICNVKDSGCGMNENLQREVLGLYEEQSIDKGIGLNVSNNLAKMMRGSLSVTSIENKGSSFKLAIPLKVSESSATYETYKANRDTGIKLEGKVLVAEDNITNQLLIKIMLENLGLKYDIVSDGKQVLSIYEDGKYSMVILDDEMPNMGGLAVMKVLRHKYGNTIPIILMSADSEKKTVDSFITEGIDDIIKKPIDDDELLDVVKKYIK